MSGPQKIYVDFSARDLDGRRYRASLSGFPRRPGLRDRFIATDYDEFDGIECEVVGVDIEGKWVYHRPVNPAAVPGTAPMPVPSPAAAHPVEQDRVKPDLLKVG